MTLSPDEAAGAICTGRVSGPLRVPGRLDLTDLKDVTLPAGLHCYELDASGSRLVSLPDDFRVDGRLILNSCPALKQLPNGLTAGSISLRNCPALVALPENLSTWFLDLSDCHGFSSWPKAGTIHHGSLILSNCLRMSSLPKWLGRLSQLDVSGCAALEEIPDGIAVTGWVDVGASGIKRLPASLTNAPLRWRGVRINHKIAFRPEELTAREVLAEKNAEVRRVMIERMGYLRFAREAKAKTLDADNDRGGKRQLLRINLHEDEALVGLFCVCPSTQRQYFLRVPPDMETCHQAAAWIAGFDDPDQYHLAVET